MLLKPIDFCVLVPSLAAVIASFFLAYAASDNRPSVFLKSETDGWVFPVDAGETINAEGPLGTTVIEISGGSARITASPCINQTCVACGPVRRPGQWAACLPNRVMLYIGEGNAAAKLPSESDIDAATW